jgi:hypothetical protein
MATIEKRPEQSPYWGIGQNQNALFHVVVAHTEDAYRQQGSCGSWFVQSDAPLSTPPEYFRCKPCDRYAREHDIRGRWDQHDEFSWERGR